MNFTIFSSQIIKFINSDEINKTKKSQILDIYMNSKLGIVLLLGKIRLNQNSVSLNGNFS